MAEQQFRAVISAEDPDSIFIEAPAEVITALGPKKRPAVTVTLNGSYTYRTTVAVYGGRYYLPVRHSVREGAGVERGEWVHVTLALDTAPREVAVPPGLARALEADPEAKAAFERMAYTHRREYVEWIIEAKREETRQRRIEMALVRLRNDLPAR